MTKKIVLNLCLVCASILFCAVIVETSLRVVFPKYKSAADSKYDQDNVLIWSPRANRRSERPHPDSGRMHAVVYNDLALRQSRNFSRLAYGTNLAFFGDSFTANLGLPAQYMFTEPLDFLLNHSGGGPFNVLNFGVNGYGTSQEYLYYEQIDLKQQLHHVFYVLCTNDIRNIYDSNLFSLDELGMLVNNPVPESSWWLKLLSRLHITYLAQDIRQRLMYSREDGWQDFGMRLQKIAWKSAHDERFHSNRADSLENSFRKGQINDDLDRAIVIFKRIISRWKKAVESNGGQFHVVLLPRERAVVFTVTRIRLLGH